MKSYCIVFDTNIFERETQIHRGQWRVFRSIARKLGFRVLIPEVVVGELSGHYETKASETIAKKKELLQSTFDLINEYFDDMSILEFKDVHEDAVKYLHLITLSAPIVDKLRDRLLKRLSFTVGKTIEIMPLPSISLNEILNRSFSAKKPFSSGGKGFKDYLIWVNLLEALQNNPHATVVFITNNTGDFGKNGLHEDLLADLRATETSRLQYYTDLVDFNKEFSAISLPHDDKFAQNLLGEGRPKFIEALEQFYEYDGSGSHPHKYTRVWDELDENTSATYNRLVPIEIEQASPIGDEEYFLIGTFIWALYASPEYNLPIDLGVHLRRGYKFVAEVVYNNKTNVVTDFAISSHEILPAYKHNFSFSHDIEADLWHVSTTSSKGDRSWKTQLPSFQKVLECARDFNIRPKEIERYLEQNASQPWVISDEVTLETLNFWKFKPTTPDVTNQE